MKITIVNTSDIRGGAAIAALRLFKTIRKTFPETLMLVREKLGSERGVIGLNRSFWKKIFIKTRFYLEIFSFMFRAESRERWFAFSTAAFGQDIVRRQEILNADIIHLHWINNGFLTPATIKKLVETGKPLVWSLHDMWAFTGGCHYPGTCEKFMKNCGNCPFLKSPSEKDLSYRIHNQKLKSYAEGNISFIAVSNWMAENARKSSLIGNRRIEVIPNPIDTDIYKPGVKSEIREKLGLPRDKFLIISGAANLNDKRKGFAFLLQALHEMKEKRPDISEKFGLITFGKSSAVVNTPIPVYPQAYLKDDYSIAKLYQAADVFVLPTLEDNLPSTVMESLSCGTPVVAFNTGGIPDMVDHLQNGYLAELKNTGELANGIHWVEKHSDLSLLHNTCRKKVVENFSNEVVSAKYIEFYRSMLK
jgi:glycosyltransferase involved in cell wall biosynthesis